MAITTGTGVAQWSFAIKQGSDLDISMTWLDDNGAPMNLTGFVMSLSIRAFQSSPIALLTLTSSSITGSRIVLGGETGVIGLVFTHADTAGLVPSSLPAQMTPLASGIRSSMLGVYDLKYTDPNGNSGYLMEGTVTLHPQVTV